MSILIKGMEMPTSCEKCPCKTADAFGGLGCQATGYIPLRKVNQNRPDWCPLIPVPPHGDLIDRDALREEWLENGENEYVYDTNAFLDSLDDAPTIIPASEEDET